MARGLFDLIAMYNQGRGDGYSPFQPQQIDPTQALGMQARANLMSTPGAGPALTGNVLGGALGSGIRALLNRRAANKPENKVAGALGNAANRAFEAKFARIMKENPEMTEQDAAVAAARELYQSSSSGEDERMKDVVRQVAGRKLAELGAFDPDAQAKFAQAAKDRRPPADSVDMKQYLSPDGQLIPVNMKDPEEVRLASEYGLVPLDSLNLQWGRPEGSGLPSDIEEATYVNPSGEQIRTGLMRREGQNKVSVNFGDLMEDKDYIKQYDELLKHSQRAEQVFKNVQQLKSFIDKEGAQVGIPGLITRTAGQGASIIDFLSNTGRAIATQDLGSAAANQQYNEFFRMGKDILSKIPGASASSLLQSKLIGIAYSMAVAQQSSARNISDNDFRKYMERLGAGISNPELFKRNLDIITEELISELEIGANYLSPKHRDAYMSQYWPRIVKYRTPTTVEEIKPTVEEEFPGAKPLGFGRN